MENKIICIHSDKGGTGKTSLTINTAALLSEMGHRVLLVDLDPQGNATFNNLADDARNAKPLIDTITGNGSALDTITNGTICDMIPGDDKINTAENSILKKMQPFFNTLRGFYDVIIIDTKPGTDAVTVGALFAADLVIIPAEPTAYDITGAQSLIDKLQTVKQNGGHCNFIGVLFNKKKRIKEHTEIIDIAKQQLTKRGVYVFNAVLNDQAKPFTNSQLNKCSIFKNYNNSTVAGQIRDYIGELNAILER